MFPFRAVAVLVCCADPLFAGITLDGSFGTKGSLPGPNYMISASFGKQVGNNLFQSFGQFNLISSESATFTGPSNIQNILSRVTGGSPSSIDGTINSDIQGANLFFLNPAGVMFGPHAQLNVSGSVAISTANYLKMADGGRFNANLGGGDILTSAPVSAFGFLNSAPPPVSITGSNTLDEFGNLVPGPGLNLAPGKSLSVVAGDIAINRGFISESRVNLVSVKSPGEVQFDATNINSAIDLIQFTKMGAVDLDSSFIFGFGDFFGGNPGGVAVRAGDAEINFSDIFADSVDVQLAGNAQITNHSQIDSSTNVTMQLGGNAQILNYSGIFASGNVIVQVGIDPLQFGSLQVANSQIVGGGSIDIFATDLQITHFSVLQSEIILIDAAGFVGISDSASLLADSNQGIAGTPAGSVFIRANQLLIESGGRILSRTFGSSDGGNVDIGASLLLIDGAGSGIFVDAEAGSSGKAGNINVQTNNLRISNGGSISTNAGFTNGGNIKIMAQRLVYLSDSSITATAGSTGGNVVIDPLFIILNNSLISASAGGQGGTITLNSNFFFDSNSPITATGGIANGAISITAPELDLGAELITLPNSLVSGANQLQERCTALLQGDFSSFISIGRGGTEPEPDELQDEY